MRDRQEPDDKVIVQDFGSYLKGFGKLLEYFKQRRDMI